MRLLAYTGAFAIVFLLAFAAGRAQDCFAHGYHTLTCAILREP